MSNLKLTYRHYSDDLPSFYPYMQKSLKNKETGFEIRRKSETGMFEDEGIYLKNGDIIKEPFDAITAYVLTNYRNEFEMERNKCDYDIKKNKQ